MLKLKPFRKRPVVLMPKKNVTTKFKPRLSPIPEVPVLRKRSTGTADLGGEARKRSRLSD
jgi:hypothetical protein